MKKELHAFEKERPDNIEINVMVSFPWALEESVTTCSLKIKDFLLSLLTLCLPVSSADNLAQVKPN